jgi:hypothetical protein
MREFCSAQWALAAQFHLFHVALGSIDFTVKPICRGKACGMQFQRSAHTQVHGDGFVAQHRKESVR